MVNNYKNYKRDKKTAYFVYSKKTRAADRFRRRRRRLNAIRKLRRNSERGIGGAGQRPIYGGQYVKLSDRLKIRRNIRRYLPKNARKDLHMGGYRGDIAAASKRLNKRYATRRMPYNEYLNSIKGRRTKPAIKFQNLWRGYARRRNYKFLHKQVSQTPGSKQWLDNSDFHKFFK